jgi:predicted DNA-binding transcriptional regulator YafY
MPERRRAAHTAEALMRRLLHILPAASRPEGALIEELARELDATPERIVADLEEVTARAYYHPGGWPDDVRIMVEGGRVRVERAGGFERPVRLTPRETLCLAVALRGTAAAARVTDQGRRLALLRRAEAHLGAGGWSEQEVGPLHAPDHAPDPAGIRETLLAAARQRHPCAIVYARAGADDLDVRVIHPYALASAGGDWYTVGWCTVKDEMRVFRVDRILEAAPGEGTFQVPDDFRVGDWVQGARVYRADGEMEVLVRYSSRIARWVRERAAAGADGWEEEPDGSVVIRHRVADPHWVVGHALQYGADAEVLEPEDVRALVYEVVGRLAG